MDLRRIYTVPFTKTPLNPSKMEKAEIEMHMANKQYFESRAQDIIDGKLRIKESKDTPEEFRPRIDAIYKEMKDGKVPPTPKLGDSAS